MNTFIIAEAGLEHQGDFKRARELVDAAKNAGADAVKFRIFFGWPPDLKQFQFGRSQWLSLWGYAESIGIFIFATCFDQRAVQFAANILDQKWWKIPDGLAACWPYLIHIMRQDPECIYYSTGMCTEEEVGAGATILGSSDLTVMHSVSRYPPDFSEINLRAIRYMREVMGFHKIGFCDHTKSIDVPVAAVALGVQVIEKHLTLDGKGPDGKIALEPWAFKNMVDGIRNVEKALGIDGKHPTRKELEVRNEIRSKQEEIWR